jgi:hypothetical protein
MGQSVGANNKLTRFTAEDYTLHRRDRSKYVRARSLINTNYFHLFYDEQTNATIRIYKNAVPGLTESDVSFDKIDTMNSNRIHELFINRPTFLQIYKGYKLSKEVPFPPDLKIIAFEKNVVWTVKKEEERLTFYKVTLN